MRSGRVTKIHPSLYLSLSKDEGLKNIGHSMSIINLVFGVSSITVSYFIRFDSFLQNATDVITKCVRFFITKCNSFITKCDSYYKMRRLLQIATVQGHNISQNNNI